MAKTFRIDGVGAVLEEEIFRAAIRLHEEGFSVSELSVALSMSMVTIKRSIDNQDVVAKVFEDRMLQAARARAERERKLELARKERQLIQEDRNARKVLNHAVALWERRKRRGEVVGPMKHITDEWMGEHRYDTPGRMAGRGTCANPVFLMPPVEGAVEAADCRGGDYQMVVA